jgi:hypothetical protein
MRDAPAMRLKGLLPLFLAVGCSPAPPPQATPPAATVLVPAAPIARASGTPTTEARPAEPRPAPTAADSSSTPEAPSPPEREPSEAEVKACTARGGKIEPVCMMGELACVVRYRDAGKRCTDKSECAGECLYEGDDSPQVNAVGRCQRTSDPCGCKAPVVHGRVQPALCAD